MLPKTTSLKDGDSTTPLGNFCQSSVTFPVKKHFPLFKWNLQSFNLGLLPLVLSWRTTGKRLCLVSALPSGVCTISEDSSGPFLLQPEPPESLSLSSKDTYSSPFIILVTVYSTLSSSSMSLSQLGTELQVWLHWCWMEGQGQDYLPHNLLATLLSMQPRIPWAFFATTLGHRAQRWPVFQGYIHGNVMLQTGSFQIGCFQIHASMGRSNLSTNFLWCFSLHCFKRM